MIRNAAVRELLGPMLYLGLIMPLIPYVGYYIAEKCSGRAPLPFNATMWAVCMQLTQTPNPIFNWVTEFLLLRALGDYSNLWVLGSAYILSIPVSLWAISRFIRRTDKTSNALAGHKVVARQVLKSPANQALALFHYGIYLPLFTADFSVSGVLNGLLIDLSSGIAHIIIAKFVLGWLHVLSEDATSLSDMDPRTRIAFLSVTVAELASMSLLLLQLTPTTQKRTHAKIAENVVNEHEASHSDEKAGSAVARAQD